MQVLQTLSIQVRAKVNDQPILFTGQTKGVNIGLLI